MPTAMTSGGDVQRHTGRSPAAREARVVGMETSVRERQESRRLVLPSRRPARSRASAPAAPPGATATPTFCPASYVVPGELPRGRDTRTSRPHGDHRRGNPDADGAVPCDGGPGVCSHGRYARLRNGTRRGHQSGPAPRPPANGLPLSVGSSADTSATAKGWSHGGRSPNDPTAPRTALLGDSSGSMPTNEGVTQTRSSTSGSTRQ